MSDTNGTETANQTTEQQTTEAPPPKGKGKGAKQAEGGNEDLAATVKALQEQVALLTKGKADAEAQAEAERKSKLSETEKLAEERKAFQTEVENTKKQFASEARETALERLKVLPNYRQMAPQVDPRTPDGAAQLEKWATDHPEILAREAAPPAPFQPAEGSKLQKMLSGALNHPYMSKDALAKLVGRA